jgi:hypothetical protein
LVAVRTCDEEDRAIFGNVECSSRSEVLVGRADDEAGSGVAWYSPYLSEEDVDDDSPEEEKEVV